MTYSYQVPVSYTINVSLTSAPQGLAEYNTNSIAIFSNEPAAFSESYQAYITPSAVEADFGTESLTYKMARALFTPVPNFRTGSGYLYIFPFSGVNATSGKVTTVSLTENISNFKNVTDGSLKLTIDGVAVEVRGLNFSNAKKLSDIVNILNNQNLDVYIEADEDDKIVFTSKRFGVSSGVELGTASSGTDIAGADYLIGASAVETAGVDASGQTLAEAVTAAKQQIYFGGILTTQYVDDETLLANSTAIQSEDAIYYEAMTSLKNIAITGAAIKVEGNSKTRSLAYSRNPETAKIAVATYATIANSVDYSGSNTANSLNLKTLTGIIGDAGLSDTYVLSAQTNGVDIYGNTGGLSVVYSNNNNGYTDDIENELWFKKAIEVAGFNYLRQTNTKIPQTEAAMTGLKSVYQGVCENSIRNGVVAPGTWNSAIPFGDPETFQKNIEEKGYYIYSIPVSQQPQVEREARKAPYVQIALKLSGALHFSEIIINVEQ